MLGFGTLSETLSPRDSRGITNMKDSGKFQAHLDMKQRQMEQMLIENRVRKLQLEEERL